MYLETIRVEVQLGAPHGGYMEFQVCNSLPETEECFSEPLLLGNGLTIWPMHLGDGDFNITTTAQLPAGLSCDHCVFRMHYRGAQHWGNCDNSASCECDPNSSPPGGMGCSEQQTFRSCSDITIT